MFVAKFVLVGNALSLRFDICYIIVKKARIPKMLFPVILPRAHKQNTQPRSKHGLQSRPLDSESLKCGV